MYQSFELVEFVTRDVITEDASIVMPGKKSAAGTAALA